MRDIEQYREKVEEIICRRNWTGRDLKDLIFHLDSYMEGANLFSRESQDPEEREKYIEAWGQAFEDKMVVEKYLTLKEKEGRD